MNDKLRKIRTALGFNSKEFVERLSEFCTITYRAYTSYEAGEHKLQPELLKILCVHFDVNLNWLVADKGEMFIKNSTSDKQLKSEVEEILRQYKLI